MTNSERKFWKMFRTKIRVNRDVFLKQCESCKGNFLQKSVKQSTDKESSTIVGLHINSTIVIFEINYYGFPSVEFITKTLYYAEFDVRGRG